MKGIRNTVIGGIVGLAAIVGVAATRTGMPKMVGTKEGYLIYDAKATRDACQNEMVYRLDINGTATGNDGIVRLERDAENKYVFDAYVGINERFEKFKVYSDPEGKITQIQSLDSFSGITDITEAGSVCKGSERQDLAGIIDATALKLKVQQYEAGKDMVTESTQQLLDNGCTATTYTLRR